jgi:hypothetical protein
MIFSTIHALRGMKRCYACATQHEAPLARHEEPLARHEALLRLRYAA